MLAMYGAGASRKVEANGTSRVLEEWPPAAAELAYLAALAPIDMDCGTQGALSPVYNRSKELASWTPKAQY